MSETHRKHKLGAEKNRRIVVIEIVHQIKPTCFTEIVDYNMLIYLL